MLDALVVVNATRSAFDILDVLLTRHIVSLRSGCFVTAIVQGRRVIPSTSCFAYRYRRKPCSWTFVFAPVSCSSTVHAALHADTRHTTPVNAGERQPRAPSLSLPLSLSLSRARAPSLHPVTMRAHIHPSSAIIIIIISHHHRARGRRDISNAGVLYTYICANSTRAATTRPRRSPSFRARLAPPHPHPYITSSHPISHHSIDALTALETTHATNHDHDGCGRPIKRRMEYLSLARTAEIDR